MQNFINVIENIFSAKISPNYDVKIFGKHSFMDINFKIFCNEAIYKVYFVI